MSLVNNAMNWMDENSMTRVYKVFLIWLLGAIGQ